jgi:hypothetical protein
MLLIGFVGIVEELFLIKIGGLMGDVNGVFKKGVKNEL